MVNYRTSHQIRTHADLLLDPELSDVDGNTEERSGTVSVFNGPTPSVSIFASKLEEIDGIAEWITGLSCEGITPNEIGVFVRSKSELPRAAKGIEAAGLESVLLQGNSLARKETVAFGIMHLAKGLEFRAVAVMACDEEVIPSKERLTQIAENSDLEDAYNTERYLLYVACTRARDHLLVTGVNPGSEFLDDLQMNFGGISRR